MKLNGKSALWILLLFCGGCVPQGGSNSESLDMGIQWVRDSSEFRALTMQTYQAATDALPGMLADPSWSALPDQVDAGGLPPAIILDVDETAVSNAQFQAALEAPFRDSKLTNWSKEHDAVAIPGAVEFVRVAIDAGVTVFFVTNRPCEPVAGAACPQEQAVVGDLLEAGFPADAQNVMLSYEQPAWSKEKSIRRNLIAREYRVIMLFGDDLGDFIQCTRRRALDPCRTGATRDSRRELVERYAAYWGRGWYVLPNPMHGSWTSVE